MIQNHHKLHNNFPEKQNLFFKNAEWSENSIGLTVTPDRTKICLFTTKGKPNGISDNVKDLGVILDGTHGTTQV